MRTLSLILCVLWLIAMASCQRTSQMDTADGNPKLVVRLASGMSPSTRLWEPANLFKQELEKASPEHDIAEGEINVEFYDQGTIGSEQQLMEATFFDVIDIIQINTSVVTTVEPSYAY